MCFPLLNHGSCILTTSQNQISPHTNNIFLRPPSSSAAFGACGSQMRGAAASLQAELPPPRHVPGIALLQQGKGRQMTAQQLHMHGLQSPALRRLTGSIPAPACLVAPPGRHQDRTWYVKFWVWSEERMDNLTCSASLQPWTCLWALTAALQQRRGIPKCVWWSAFQTSSREIKTFCTWHFPIIKLWVLLSSDNYSFQSFSKTSLNWNKDLLFQHVNLWVGATGTCQVLRAKNSLQQVMS